MKMILLTLCAVFLVGLTLDTAAADKGKKKASKTKGDAAETSQDADEAKKEKPRKGTLYHVVSFKFKSSASEAQIKEVEDAFRDLQKSIKQIKKYEWGTNVSPENHAKGFTHGFILTFKSAQDRDDYLVHPDHKAFGALLGPILDDVFVIDFWAEK